MAAYRQPAHQKIVQAAKNQLAFRIADVDFGDVDHHELKAFVHRSRLRRIAAPGVACKTKRACRWMRWPTFVRAQSEGYEEKEDSDVQLLFAQ